MLAWKDSFCKLIAYEMNYLFNNHATEDISYLQLYREFFLFKLEFLNLKSPNPLAVMVLFEVQISEVKHH